jgi:hypothetical protein
MTTEQDKGCVGEAGPMLSCDLDATHTYSNLVLALRDMRTANGRDTATGVGDGNASWIGLAIGMIVLDILSTTGQGEQVGVRFRRLLTDHGVGEEDARYIYKFRCALHHAYGIPAPVISVPAFCGRLVERIAYEAPKQQVSTLINTHIVLD